MFKYMYRAIQLNYFITKLHTKHFDSTYSDFITNTCIALFSLTISSIMFRLYVHRVKNIDIFYGTAKYSLN